MHRFQAILNGAQETLAPWDRVVFESQSFIAVPSLGSLVPGWLMLVPRRDMLSLRDLTPSEKTELAQFAAKVTHELSSFGGEVFQFEHGNETPGGVTGCGVDQAHLHVVPLGFDLISAAVETVDPVVDWQLSSFVHDFASTIPCAGEYVSIWNAGNGLGLTGNMRQPRSQWVRRVIAQQLGREKAWDYKAHPDYQNLLQTISALQRA